MRYYFTLQYLRLSRKLNDIGIHPYLGIALTAALFFVFSKLLFFNTPMAPWLYIFGAASFLFKLSEGERNDILRGVFDKKEYHQVRLIENIFLSLLFISYLLYEAQYLTAILLLSAAILMSAVVSKPIWNKAFPTPFWKFPFEFIIGFRKTVLLLVFALFLAAKGIQVDNYNLAMFALGLTELIGVSYFLIPDQEYFVWIFDKNSKEFLKYKIVTALLSVSILCIPILLFLLITYPHFAIQILGLMLYGYLLMVTVVLAKYSAHPKEMNLPQALLFSLSVLFPPMLMIAIPLFYKHAIRKLEATLG